MPYSAKLKFFFGNMLLYMSPRNTYLYKYFLYAKKPERVLDNGQFKMLD